MASIIDTVEYKGCTIEVIHDENPWDPRNDDKLGTMVCWSRRYNIGEIHISELGDFRDEVEVQYHLIKKLMLWWSYPST